MNKIKWVQTNDSNLDRFFIVKISTTVTIVFHIARVRAFVYQWCIFQPYSMLLGNVCIHLFIWQCAPMASVCVDIPIICPYSIAFWLSKCSVFPFYYHRGSFSNPWILAFKCCTFPQKHISIGWHIHSYHCHRGMNYRWKDFKEWIVCIQHCTCQPIHIICMPCQLLFGLLHIYGNMIICHRCSCHSVIIYIILFHSCRTYHQQRIAVVSRGICEEWSSCHNTRMDPVRRYPILQHETFRQH